MKKIALSLATIAAMLTMTVAATGAYFSDTKHITGNTFSTGTVQIGNLDSTHLIVTNLAPGVWTPYYNVDIPYIGSLNADLYAAAYGNGQDYIADQLTVQIVNKDSGTVVFQDTANKLSQNWAKVASNIGPNSWNHFALAFMLDANSTKQGVTNTNTYFLLYAVQVNGPAPLATSIPTAW